MMESEKESGSGTSARRKKPVGVKVDEAIWRQFRSLAVAQGKTAGDLLDQLMTEYVEKARSNEGSRI